MPVPTFREIHARPEVVAHRGASATAPENTLAAMRAAWEVGADATETDVYLTRDGRIVALHDGTTARTGDADLKVDESTLAELRKLDMGSWKGEQWTGERIPLLEEILALVPAGRRILIEVKCGAQILPELLRVCSESGLQEEQMPIICFNQEVISTIKRTHPSFTAYWLCQVGADNGRQLVETALALKADGIDAQAADFFNAEFVQMCRAAGLGVYAWTVDDDATALRLAELGVDGITTNKPREMLSLLCRPQA